MSDWETFTSPLVSVHNNFKEEPSEYHYRLGLCSIFGFMLSQIKAVPKIEDFPKESKALFMYAGGLVADKHLEITDELTKEVRSSIVTRLLNYDTLEYSNDVAADRKIAVKIDPRYVKVPRNASKAITRLILAAQIMSNDKGYLLRKSWPDPIVKSSYEKVLKTYDCEIKDKFAIFYNPPTFVVDFTYKYYPDMVAEMDEPYQKEEVDIEDLFV